MRLLQLKDRFLEVTSFTQAVSLEYFISLEVVAILEKEKAEADSMQWEFPCGSMEGVDIPVSSISSSGMSYAKVRAETIATGLHSRSISPVQPGKGLAQPPSSKSYGSSSFVLSCQEKSITSALIGRQGCTHS